MKHCETNHVMGHVVWCLKPRSAVEALPCGAFVHLLVFGDRDLCPDCVDAIEGLVNTWREETGIQRKPDEDE